MINLALLNLRLLSNPFPTVSCKSARISVHNPWHSSIDSTMKGSFQAANILLPAKKEELECASRPCSRQTWAGLEAR